MEDWETELRAKLEKELPEGIYKIEFQHRNEMYGGKLFMTEMYVGIERAIRNVKIKSYN